MSNAFSSSINAFIRPAFTNNILSLGKPIFSMMNMPCNMLRLVVMVALSLNFFIISLHKVKKKLILSYIASLKSVVE